MKSILAHLTGTSRDEDVLAAASLAVHGFSGHLDCLYTRPDPLLLARYPAGMTFGAAGDIAEVVRAVKETGDEGARNSSETYQRFLRAQNLVTLEAPSEGRRPSASYREETGDPALLLIQASRSHDLTVVGIASQSERGITPDDAGAVLMECGRPMLLVPEHYDPRSFRTIAIAWKNRPEPARAVTAAMPLIERAEKIVLLGVHESGPPEALLTNMDAVAAQFRWHGPQTERRLVMQEGLSVPAAVLKAAREERADLLVMGAYGHSRLRELFFGGFTERVLHGVDIPVFAAH